VETKLEVVVIPVADVDRAKRFYLALGWREDADVVTGETFRVVQVTPPGSGCSVIFGVGVTTAAPGSAQGLVLAVADVQAARAELSGRGADVSDVFHDAGGVFHHAGTAARVPGPDPDRRSYASFASFGDPDGNGWVLQEVSTRLPGREWEAPAGEADVAALAGLLHEAEENHGRYEPTAPQHPWWDWYAAFVVARRQGRSPAEAYDDAVRALEPQHR
jgi:catechol 2,3-dioxygenase-like lactoylglutathione lyase family enzyme